MNVGTSIVGVSRDRTAPPRTVATGGSRLVFVDMARGVAIAGVVLFHLVWDLDLAGMIPSGFAASPLWIGFGRVLAGTFMFLVGVSLVLAHPATIRWRSYMRRLGVIAVAALAITGATLLIFPQSFIYFGILHAIVAASLIGLFFLRVGPGTILLASIAVLASPYLMSAAVFNARWLAWIGFAQQPPASNDFVPIFPWVGLTLLGIFVAKLAVAMSIDGWLQRREPFGRAAQSLAFLGRHSLVIYLVHQPILLAIIIPMARLG